MSKILFLGDLMFGDQPVLFGFGFDSVWKSKGYEGIFNGVKDIIRSADYTIANFEAIIKERSKNDAINTWSMCCDDRIIKELKENKINIVSIANNHTYDYGKEWFNNTVRNLQENNIKVIGLKNKPYEILEVNNKKIAIIGASYVGTLDKENVDMFFCPTQTEWKELFYELDYCDEKIVYIHWGNEFITNPSEEQVRLANEIIESGADCIIGHHSHILQDAYLIKDKPVYFSLGNFVTDYWQQRLRNTEIIEIDYSTKKSFNKYPCNIGKQGIPEYLGKKEKLIFNNNEILIATKEDIIKARKLIRIEYIKKIILNFWKVKNKFKFFKWIFLRVDYIIRYGKLEKENPNIIYEKYKLS